MTIPPKTEPQPRSKVREDMASPVDLPGEKVEASPFGWTGKIIATATLFLFLFNANALNGWAAELPPSALTARIVATTGAWEGFTDTIGLGAPRAWLHARWKKAEAARFGGAEGAPPQ
jgi:hypothetical protein